jgi:O-antigen ligase
VTARPRLLIIGLVALSPIVLAPALVRPKLGLIVALAPIVVFLATRSVAYPVALLGLPTLVIALMKTDPFPSGFVAAATFGWTALAIFLALVGREEKLPLWVVVSVPVLSSILLALVMLVRLGGSDATDYGGLKTKLFILENVTLLVGGILIAESRKHLDLFLVLTLVVAGLSATLLLYRLLRGDVQALFDSRFTISSELNPIQLGRESAQGLIIGVYALIASRRGSLRALALCLSPALGVSLIAAGSRGPVLGALVGLVVLLALTLKERETRLRLIFFVGSGLAVAVLAAQILPGQSISRSLSFLTGSGSGLSSTGRYALWSEAQSLFVDHPLFGIGTGGFFAADGVNHYPHNLLVEVAAELGFVGLALLLAFLVSSGASLARAWRESSGEDRSGAAVVAALFAAALVNSLFSGDIQTNAGLWLAAGLGLGLTLRAGGRRAAEADQADRPANRSRAPWPEAWR